MDISLDTLSMAGTELTTEQLDEVDGGLILIMCLAIFDIALMSYGIGYNNGKHAN